MTTYIVLPFRDRKGKYQKALDLFLEPFVTYINSNVEKYKIYIVEQNDSNEFFNLARTINIGYDLFKYEMKNDDVFIFHPVDILPIDTNYNFTETTKICSIRHSPSGEYYKGIAFLLKDFKKINGFSNEYWGWGLEDDDMSVRMNIHSIQPKIVLNQYTELCDDGNSLPGEPLFFPNYTKNISILNNLKCSKNCLISGLNTLEYKLLDVQQYQMVEKFLIE